VAFLEDPGGWAASLGTKALVGLRPPKLNLLDQEIKTDASFDRVNFIVALKSIRENKSNGKAIRL
jgi:hypothetical protein